MRSLIICLLFLCSCGFKPLYDTAESTLKAEDLVFYIKSKDMALNNRLKRELKLVAKPLMLKPYQVEICLNAQQSPLLYDDYGSPKRWHASLNADVIIKDFDGKILGQKRIWSRQSFDHLSEQDRLQATEMFEDLLVKDLALQIRHFIEPFN